MGAGKWVQESKDVHHYFKDPVEADDDVGRVHLVGNAVVARAKIKVFEPNGLWFAVALNGSFHEEDPPAGTPDCGNFCVLEDAKKWVEEKLVLRDQ